MNSNEGIIDAEADVHQQLDRSSSASRRGGAEAHRAEHAALIAGGGVHSHHHEHDEETPLLFGNRDDASAERGRKGPPDSKAQEEEWPGQKDFDGAPWWKRPSVCAYTLDQILNTISC